MWKLTAGRLGGLQGNRTGDMGKRQALRGAATLPGGPQLRAWSLLEGGLQLRPERTLTSSPDGASRKQKVGAPLEDRTPTPSCIGAQDSRLRLQQGDDNEEHHDDDDSDYHKIHSLGHRFPPSWARKQGYGPYDP